MNLNLDSNISKLIVLVVVGVLLLLGINTYQKQLGKQCAILASILVIVVCGYYGYILLNNEKFTNPNESDAPSSLRHIDRFDDYGRDKYIENFEDQQEQDDQAAREAAQQQAAREAAQAAREAAQQQAAREAAQRAEQQQAARKAAQQPPAGNVANILAEVKETNVNNDMNIGNFLPSGNSLWNQMVPSGDGDVNVNSQLNAAFFIGTNTVGNSLRNASYDLRATPPNPQGPGPCPETTIGPDLMRRTLEACSN